ncbi:hypothetical protein [Haloarchaeobius sp. TZWWS8]|uniref:hypothetical protein n=1 Tax=Haloarchaeobius sp. TZWWS8 TaxID=3446121 RepID=UPI003EBCC046
MPMETPHSESSTGRTARQIASKHVAARLTSIVYDDITDHFGLIISALENGSELDTTPFENARYQIQLLEELLEDAARLQGHNPWETGVLYGNLTQEERDRVDQTEDTHE